MNSRPLMQNGIESLEAMYSSSMTDPKALKLLRDELTHRHLPRAAALLQRVHEALVACGGIAESTLNSRPLMQNGIESLEALYSSSMADAKALRQLQEELIHRHVPRAVTLLQKVREALDASQVLVKPEAPPAAAASHSITQPKPPVPVRPSAVVGMQPELWPTDDGQISSDTHTVSSNAATIPTPPKTQGSAAVHDISVDEAYRILLATPNSTWESIEATRRKLVQLSNPNQLAKLSATKRTEAIADARKANAAYSVLQTTRLPRCD